MKVKTEEFIGTSDSRHERLLAERGRRIAYGFFRIRNRLGLVTTEERSREELIAYQARRREDPVGIVWPEEDMEDDTWRLLNEQLNHAAKE